VKGFKKWCISSRVDETDDSLCWNGSEEDGDVKSRCVEDEGTDCGVETATLIGMYIESDMLCVLSVWDYE